MTPEVAAPGPPTTFRRVIPRTLVIVGVATLVAVAIAWLLVPALSIPAARPYP